MATTTDDRLLSRAEAADRLKLSPWRFAQVAAKSPTLLRGKRSRGRRHYWRLSAVVSYMDQGMLREARKDRAS